MPSHNTLRNNAVWRWAKQERDAEDAVGRDQELRSELLRRPYLDLPHTIPQAEKDRLDRYG